jgi:ElaB/YqjD/DUF883 family membrane-anchored ribosome-binding protein
MMSESEADQDRIEEDLARTRARMDERLSALQERLSPGQVLDDLMAYFRGSEGGDFARNLMSSVQNNPMPAAITGIGLAWLMASNPRPKPASPSPAAGPAQPMGRVSSPAAWANNNEFDRHIRSVEEGVVRQTDEEDSAFHGRVDEARGKAIGLVRDAQDTAEMFGKRVQDGLAAARRTVTDAAQNLTDSAGDTARQVTEAVGNAGDQLARGTRSAQQVAGNLLSSMSDNPMLLGAIGLTVGAMLGALVPRSEQEQAAFGDVGRRAREGVGEIAQEAVNRGAAVARQVVHAARESAAGEGLAGKTAGHFVDEALEGNLAGSVGEIARDVLKAGDEAIRKDGLGQGEQAESPVAEATRSPSADRPHPGSPGPS